MVLRNKNSHSIRGKWIDCKPAYDKNQEEENLFNEENSDFEGKFFF